MEPEARKMDVKINAAIANALNAQLQQKKTVDQNDARHYQQNTDSRTTRTSRADSIELTASAKYLQTLAAMVEDQPVVNSQKVSDIKQLLESGQLKISPESTADKMIRMENTIARHLYDS